MAFWMGVFGGGFAISAFALWRSLKKIDKMMSQCSYLATITAIIANEDFDGFDRVHRARIAAVDMKHEQISYELEKHRDQVLERLGDPAAINPEKA
jgi:hypothetical protein